MQDLLEEATLADILASTPGGLAERLEDAGFTVLPLASRWTENEIRQGRREGGDDDSERAGSFIIIILVIIVELAKSRRVSFIKSAIIPEGKREAGDTR